MQKIAEGVSSEIYELDQATIVKIFRDGYGDIVQEKEYYNNLLISKTNIKTAKVKGLITINAKKGIAFEKLTGTTVKILLKTKPWLIFHYARKFAETHVAILRCSCPGLPEQKAALKQFIYLKNLSRDEEGILLNELDRLPGGDNVCHNDFNLDNVILCENGYYTIDWFCVTNGHPAMDIAHTYINLKGMVEGSRYSPVKLLKRIYFYLFSLVYLKHSMALLSLTSQQIKTWGKFLLSIDIHKWQEPIDVKTLESDSEHDPVEHNSGS